MSDVEGVPKLEKPRTQKPKCDFCDATPVRWSYPVNEERAAKTVRGIGGYAACDACARLIEKDDPDALRRRAVKRYSRDPDFRGFTQRQIEMRVRWLHQQFWTVREGKRVECDPDSPLDPTKEDMLSKMMWAAGQRIGVNCVQESDDDDTTFSERQLNEALSVIPRWVGTRIMRRWGETGVGPKRLRLEIRAVLDDEADDDEAPFQFLMPDVRHGNGST